MLRESSKLEGLATDLQIVTQGSSASQSDADTNTNGIPFEAKLMAFAEAVLGNDTGLISAARNDVIKVLGIDAMVDAACIIANFQRMVRIADGTGIPLDPPVAMITADLRDSLKLNNYDSAAYTIKIGFFKRLIGRLLGKILPFLSKRL